MGCAALVGGAGRAVVGCGSSSSDSSSSGDAEAAPATPIPNVDHGQHPRGEGRDRPQATPPNWKVAWTLPLESAEHLRRLLRPRPVIANGVVYSRTSNPTCRRSSLDSGEVLWTKKYESADQGPNGVAVADGKVFGATAERSLRARPGNRQGAVVGAGGRKPASDRHGAGLQRRARLRLDRADQRQRRIPGRRRRHPLRARRQDREEEVDTSTPCRRSLWGDKEVNSGGGLWYPPSFDEKGSMYFGTGNPAPYPGHAGEAVGLEPARPEPLHQLAGQARREDRASSTGTTSRPRTTSTTGTSRTPPILAKAGGTRRGDRLGQVRRSSSRSTRRPASRSGARRSATTTATTTTASTRCEAKTRRSSRAKSCPGNLGGVIAPIGGRTTTTVFVPVVNRGVDVNARTGDSTNTAELPGEMVALDIATGKVDWEAGIPRGRLRRARPWSTTSSSSRPSTASSTASTPKPAAKSGRRACRRAPTAGVAVSGDTLVVPAGDRRAPKARQPELVAYRLGG